MTRQQYKLALGIFLVSLFPTAWLIRPYVTSSDVTACAFRIITGRPCPFCGLTRALACALHGEFQAASEYNFLWFLAVLLIAGIGGLSLADGLTGTDHVEKLRHATAFADKYIIIFLTLFTLCRW